jgi:hypothetical protein
LRDADLHFAPSAIAYAQEPARSGTASMPVPINAKVKSQ